MADTLAQARRAARRLREELLGAPPVASGPAARLGDAHEILPSALAASLPREAWIVGERGAPLASVEAGTQRPVVIDRGCFARTLGRARRAALLERAATLAGGAPLFVHAPVSPLLSPLGRLVVDLPRGVAAALGVPSGREPGDRHDGTSARHVYFGEEPLLREVAAAGFAVTAREGYWLRLERATRLHAEPSERSPLAAEIARAWAIYPRVERWRRGGSTRDAIERARAHGRACRVRDELGRARLRRAITWVDHLAPLPPNCLRRVLLESALDAGAAADRIALALDVGATGHAYFPSREEASLDVTFVV